MPRHNQLAASVDSLHGFKEPKSNKKNKHKEPLMIDINPTHQFMDAIRAANANRTFDSEEFPTPEPNKFVYSRDELLRLWKPHDLPAGTLILPETTTEKNFIPVCKDEVLMKEYKDALYGNGKWAALQSPVRSTRPRGRGRGKVSRGRADLLSSVDNSRKPRDDKSKNWSITQSTDSGLNTQDPNPAAPPPPVASSKLSSLQPSQAKEKPSEPVKWQYIDDQGKIEGPFEASTMSVWFKKGYFPPTLKVKTTLDNSFVQLGELAIGGNDPFRANTSAAAAVKAIKILMMRTSDQDVQHSSAPVQPVQPQKPVQTQKPSDFQGNPSPMVGGFSPFASLLGISPEDVLQTRESSVSSGSSDWGSPKVWKVDQLENQWRSTSQANSNALPVSSPWGKPSLDSKPLLQDIQEQQVKQERTSLRSSTSAVSTPQPSSFNPWGLSPSDEPPVITKVNVHDLFSGVSETPKAAPNDWKTNAGSYNESQERNAQEEAKTNLPRSSVGWGSLSNASTQKKSLEDIKREEEQQRQIEQRRMYEEQRQMQQNLPSFAWSAPNPNESLSLQQIQQLQMEEARRQQEQARVNAQQMAEAQQTAMWSTPHSGRPRSLLEIQEEEMRQKQMQEQQQQQRAAGASVNLSMWGPSWGAAGASFTQIQEQQAQQLSSGTGVGVTASGNSLRSSSSAVATAWGAQPEPQPKSQVQRWNQEQDDDSLLWDPKAAAKPAAPADDFPSLANTPQPKSPARTQKKSNKKGNKKQNTPAPTPAPISEPSFQQVEPKGKAGRKKNKKRMQKVDASEFFSFGSGSLAGRAIEGPDYA